MKDITGGCFFPISSVFCLIYPPTSPVFEIQNLLYSYRKFDETGWDPCKRFADVGKGIFAKIQFNCKHEIFMCIIYHKQGNFFLGRPEECFFLISDRALVLVIYIFSANFALMSCTSIFWNCFFILTEQFIGLPISINFALIFR